jgi:probable phosphoglycerate mutase
MTRIALIRHGATVWNDEGRFQGRADTQLSPEGRAELRRLEPPASLQGATWLASPLARTMETARLLGHPAIPEPALIETNWGAFEGLTRAATTALSHRISARGHAGLDFRAPGGESPREVQQRLQHFFRHLAADGPSFAVCVTHKGIIRATLSLAIGWDMIDKPPIKLKWRAAHLFQIAPDGHVKLEAPNLLFRPRA